MKHRKHKIAVNQYNNPDDQFLKRKRAASELIRLFIVFTVPFLLYSGTINHDYIIDDTGILSENRFVRQGLSGISDLLTTNYRAGIHSFGDNIYRPLSQVMYAVEWEISPGNASLSHFLNVLFYALTCLLFYILLKSILTELQGSTIVVIALFFAAHPVHTEAVAYIKGRDEIMSLFFLLIAFIVFIKWLKGQKAIYILFASTAYFLSLMSKEGVITMLAVFPLIGWYFTQASPKKLLSGTLVMVIPATAYLIIRYMVLSVIPNIYDISPVDNFLVLAPDLIVRLATSIKLIGKYLLLLVFPATLVNDYSYNQIPLVGPANACFLISFTVLAFLFYYCIKHFRKKDPIVFGLLFMCISASIYTNILFLIGTSFAERLMFVPSVGFSISIVLLIERLTTRSKKFTEVTIDKVWRSKRWFFLVSGFIILFFAIKTITRSAEWKDIQTLVSSDIKKSGNSARMHLYQGNIYRDLAIHESDLARRDSLLRLSKAAFEHSLEIFPSYSDAIEKLGLVHYLLGDSEQALEHFQSALNKNPLLTEAWNNMGSIYVDRGSFQISLECFQKAVDTNPYYAKAWQNIGSVYGRMGEYDKAIPFFYKAIALEPHNALNYQLLGLTYQHMGRTNDAKLWFEKASNIRELQTN